VEGTTDPLSGAALVGVFASLLQECVNHFEPALTPELVASTLETSQTVIRLGAELHHGKLQTALRVANMSPTQLRARLLVIEGMGITPHDEISMQHRLTIAVGTIDLLADTAPEVAGIQRHLQLLATLLDAHPAASNLNDRRRRANTDSVTLEAPKTMSKPTVLISYTSTGKRVAEIINSQLQEFAEPTLEDYATLLSKTKIEDLESYVGNYEYAIIVIVKDTQPLIADTGETGFKVGYLLGKLGREKVFVVVPSSEKDSLPDYLGGINPAPYNDQRSDGKLDSPVNSATRWIRDTIQHSYSSSRKTT
jgi:predicted nucleotide-binding protein